MKAQIEKIQKHSYSAPLIEEIQLDDEISLALESTPPTYEMNKGSKVPEYFNNDPFKNNIG